MKEKVKAFVSALMVLCVSMFAVCGVDLDGDALTNAVLVILDACAVLFAAWKNHNFTDEAVMAQEYKDALKLHGKHVKED